jgi:hypothetical protein
LERTADAVDWTVSRPIIIYSLDHAHAALGAAAGLRVPVRLHSAPDAGAAAGVGWFERVVATAQAEFPSVDVTAVLDCGDAAGAVMGALRWLKTPGRAKLALCFRGDAATAERLAEMAAALDVMLVRDLPPGLDLRREADPAAACRTWLAGVAADTAVRV